MIRSILAGVLRGVVSQRLLPRAGGGRVPAVEVMVTNARIADLIREGRPDEITDAVADGEFFEMQTFSQALIDLVARGDVEPRSPRTPPRNRHDFLVDARASGEAARRPSAEAAASRSRAEATRRRSRKPEPGARARGAATMDFALRRLRVRSRPRARELPERRRRACAAPPSVVVAAAPPA